ncbi:MAG: PHP domain-containing protein [Lachnospiraceae bacterium]
MFIDLHMHEMTYSEDSFLKLEEIVIVAKARGLQGICITDHDSMGLKEYAKEYSKQVDFPIFVGIEYYSLQGDILAFGIDDFPKERLNAQEFITLVKEQGGVCFSAHPFRNNHRGLGAGLSELVGLDGVEVLNGSTSPQANQKAFEYASQLNLIPIGASDCHIPEKIGIYSTYFPKQISTMEELVNALKNGRCQPAYYEHGRYRIWDTQKKALAV